VTSDEFFAGFAAAPEAEALASADPPGVFDIIYIDGLHTYEQSYTDFVNSLAVSHEKTVWLIDDTVPCDMLSALPDYKMCAFFRHKFGLVGNAWHGDVFKTLFAVHQAHKDFPFCTVTHTDNPRSVAWRIDGGESKRPDLFSSRDAIGQLTFFDLPRLAQHMHFVSTDDVLSLLYLDFQASLSFQESIDRLFYAPLLTKKEIKLGLRAKYLTDKYLRA
jgi:hypothetical protein